MIYFHNIRQYITTKVLIKEHMITRLDKIALLLYENCHEFKYITTYYIV